MKPSLGLVAVLFLSLPLSVAQAAEIVWTNLAGGTWATAANWSPNQVPTANDTAYITNTTSFTVTLGATAVVSNLFLGAGLGTVSNRFDQNSTLTVHGVARVLSNGWFRMSGQMNVSNEFHNGGFFQWLDSPMRGNGTFVNQSNGLLHTRSAGVSTLGVRTFNNFGRFIAGSDDAGVQMASNCTFTNHAGAELELNIAGAGVRDASGATGTLLVNHGTIRAGYSSPSSPAYLTVFFLNYGTLSQETPTWYIGAGTNYGTIAALSAAYDLSQVDNDPFVFDAGTVFTSPTPQLWAGGHLLFNTPVTVNASSLHVGDGSGGASTTAPALTILNDVTLNSAVSVSSGRINILSPTANVFMKQVTIQDNNVIGDPNPYITNAASLTVNSFVQNFSVTDNAGVITIRTNLAFAAGNFRGSGIIVLASNSSSTISGTGSKTFNGQSIINRGTMTATTGATFANGASWLNESGSTFNANGGLLNDNGTGGWFLNQGTFRRTALVNGTATDLQFTNAGGLVAAQNGTLGISFFTQTSGRTELRGGDLSGTLTLLGGTLDGAGNVGTLINGASVLPGNPLGIIRPTGNYTNLAAGVYQMQVGATNNYDRINVAGTAHLAGTLNVLFTNGFYPVIGNTFTAMTYTARSGVFDQVLLPGYDFEVIYTATNLLLRASNALPIVAFTISGGNTQWVCQPFKLSASATDPDGIVTNIAFYMNNSLIGSFAGSSASLSVESDFPATNSFTARATDDRSGVRSTNHEVALVTAPLHLLSLGGMRTNGFKICMLGEAGSNYLVFATTNLNLPYQDWVNLGTMESTNGIWRHLDAGATNLPGRFYRAQQD